MVFLQSGKQVSRVSVFVSMARRWREMKQMAVADLGVQFERSGKIGLLDSNAERLKFIFRGFGTHYGSNRNVVMQIVSGNPGTDITTTDDYNRRGRFIHKQR